MAKTGQKRKRAEKAKTQLKTSMKNAGRADKKKKVRGASGIRLPKGLNETRPDVRVKTINVAGTKDVGEVKAKEAAAGERPGKKYRPVKVRRKSALPGLTGPERG